MYVCIYAQVTGPLATSVVHAISKDIDVDKARFYRGITACPELATGISIGAATVTPSEHRSSISKLATLGDDAGDGGHAVRKSLLGPAEMAKTAHALARSEALCLQMQGEPPDALLASTGIILRGTLQAALFTRQAQELTDALRAAITAAGGWRDRTPVCLRPLPHPAYIHTYTHTGMYTYLHTHIHTFIHTYIHYIHTYIHTLHYIHTYIHTCIHTYIQSYTHTYIHTYRASAGGCWHAPAQHDRVHRVQETAGWLANPPVATASTPSPCQLPPRNARDARSIIVGLRRVLASGAEFTYCYILPVRFRIL